MSMVWEVESGLVAVTLPPRSMSSAPVITSAITSTAPTARPASELRKTGNFLVRVFTTVRVSVAAGAPGTAAPVGGTGPADV